MRRVTNPSVTLARLRIETTSDMRHQRIAAGIPDGATVDLSLIKLPDDALIFPALPETGEDFSFSATRIPRNFTKEFRRRAKLLAKNNARLARMRFHDLRGTHATQLLDRGVPVHQVAARMDDDPAILLRVYAKLTRKPNNAMADAVNALATSFLKN